MEKKLSGFPFSHVLGFLLSLLLTLLASAVVLKTALLFEVKMWIISALAMIQAGIQLILFMHVREGEDGKTQLINVVYGFILAVIIVAGSVWVMSFGMHS